MCGRCGFPAGRDRFSPLRRPPAHHVRDLAAAFFLNPRKCLIHSWNVISASWDNVLHYPSSAGRGLNEVEFGQIIDAIAGSV